MPDLRPKGSLFKILGYLDRPRMTISEAVQAAMAGEDVSEAAVQGWKGRPKYGTLGEAAFPEAAEPGFQAEDVPAFAIDVLTDPTTWLGPGAIKAVGKPLAKGALKLGAKALPREGTKILADLSEAAVRSLPKTERINLIKKEMDEIGLTVEEAFGRVWRLTDKDKREKLRTIRELRPGSGRVRPFDDPMKKVTEETIEELPDDGLTVLQEGLRDLQTNIRPEEQTSLNSLVQSAAKRFAPAGAFLRTFNGKLGKVYDAKYKTALFNSDDRVIPWVKALEDLTKLPGVKSRKNREEASKVVEGLIAPRTKEIADMAAGVSALTKAFFKEVTSPEHYDEFGSGLMVWDDMTRKEIPLVEAFVENYFPRRLSQDAFSAAGHNTLRKKMRAAGMHSDQINDAINKLRSIQPKKVGHVEFARNVSESMLYERDFLKVLPKYFHDVIWRQELGKQFGMNNEILDALTEELIQAGADPNWLQKLSTGIIGRNPYYDKIENLMRNLGTFQAISKLGFATSAANLSQAYNGAMRSGFGNFAKSTEKFLETKAGFSEDVHNFGILSLSRKAWGDIATTAGHEPGGGVLNFFGDMYMRGIGFPMTERIGRHIGAIGGSMEVQALAKKIAGSTGKKRGRLLSEIGRKYNVTEDMINPVGQLVDPVSKMVDPQIIRRAAWDAARNTMHAFDVMEMPVWWQDPTWKMISQFKSFIYKQSEFMFNEVAMPGIQWFATNGAKGDVKPLLRAMVATPVVAELVTHGRDIVKSVPTRVVEAAKNYHQGDPLTKTKWDYKDPFWEDADPAWRILSDSIYVGMFGIVGDMYESARMGRLADWLAGPTIGDVVDVGQAAVQGKGLGKVGTQMIPGAFGVPYGADITETASDFYKKMMREAARRRLQ